MNYIDTIDMFINALQEEIDYLKYYGGRQYLIVDGKQLNIKDGKYLYVFELESEINISDGLQIRLILGSKILIGEIVSIDHDNIFISLETYIGEFVDKAHITCDPWFLLEGLQKRLSECQYGERIGQSRLIVEESYHKYTEKTINDIPNLSKIDEYAKMPVSFVWGPPGTGKTTNLAKQALKYVKDNKRVLIVSQSNISVDEAILKIKELNYDNIQGIYRYGFVQNRLLSEDKQYNAEEYILSNNQDLIERRENIRKELVKLKTGDASIEELKRERTSINNEIKRKIDQLIIDAKIVATTISKATIDSLIYDNEFDVVIFDEASMAYIPQIIYASSLARSHFLVFGDFRQLAPISQSTDNELLTRDIYTFMNIIDDSRNIYYHPWLIMLDTQYRSYPKIVEFVNNEFYHKMIKNYEGLFDSEELLNIINTKPFVNEPIIFVSTDSIYSAAGKTKENSRFNIVNAVISLMMAIEIEKKSKKRVGIITPYNAQARLIKKMIEDYKDNKKKCNIDCSTVHQFQGSERDVIIFDTVESYPSTRPGMLTSSNENQSLDRLVNVAITRSKGKFILVGNSDFWHNYKANNSLQKLMKYITRKGLEVSGASLIKYLQTKTRGRFKYYEIDDGLLQFNEDIEYAKKSIQIILPHGEMVDRYWLDTLSNNNNNIDIFIKSVGDVSLNKELNKLIKNSDNAYWPLTIIDNEIIWYGMPDMDKYFVVKKERIREFRKIVLRIEGKGSAKIMSEFIDINTISGSGVLRDGQITMSQYLIQKVTCPKCGAPMTLVRGRKLYTKCSRDDYTNYLELSLVNDYIKYVNLVSPHDGTPLRARLGRYGVIIESTVTGDVFSVEDMLR